LTIDNPQGYRSDYAAKFKTIKIDLDISSLRTNTIVMNEAIIDGARQRRIQRRAKQSSAAPQ
jgi:hypothetical protein